MRRMHDSKDTDEFSPRASRLIRQTLVPLTKTTLLRRTWMTVGWFGKNGAAIWTGLMFADLDSGAVYIGLALFGIAALVEQVALFGLKRTKPRLWKDGTASAIDQAVSVLLAGMGASAFTLPGVPQAWTLPVAVLVGVGLYFCFIWNDGPVGSVVRDASKTA